MAVPRKIFLETTALVQLGPRLENADLARLLEIRASSPFELLIAEVSWMEFLRHRKAEVSETLDKIRSVASTLQNHGTSLAQITRAEKSLQNYLARIGKHFGEKAAKLGFRIVPLPKDIKVRSLLEMSIECVPPYEPREKKSEKGFRDSLIMFSILQEIQGRPDDSAVLVCNDGLLVDGISIHAEQFGTSIHALPDLPAAVEFVETGMDENKRAEIRASINEAKQVLKQFEKQIVDRVTEIGEISDSDLGQAGPFFRFEGDARNLYGILGKPPEEYVEIHRLEAVSFDGVVTAVWKEKQPATARIMFMIRCKARVRARAPHLATYDGDRKYKVGASYSQYGLVHTFSVGDVPTEEREMPFHLYGEVHLQKSDQGWSLASLRIDKSLASDAEYEELSQAGEISSDLSAGSVEQA
jgi:hypothetical protein